MTRESVIDKKTRRMLRMRLGSRVARRSQTKSAALLRVGKRLPPPRKQLEKKIAEHLKEQ